MKVLHAIYNNKDIEFAIKGENIMVNATQMAQAFGKETKYFLETDHAKEYIKILENHLQNEIIQGVKTDRINPKAVEYRGRNGVLFDRRLALKFAAWLSPEFELWVYTTIDKILTGHFKEQEEAIKQKLQAEEKLEKKKQELLEKYPDFVEFLDLQEEIKRANKKRVKAVKQKVKQLQLELFPNK